MEGVRSRRVGRTPCGKQKKETFVNKSSGIVVVVGVGGCSLLSLLLPLLLLPACVENGYDTKTVAGSTGPLGSLDPGVKRWGAALFFIVISGTMSRIDSAPLFRAAVYVLMSAETASMLAVGGRPTIQKYSNSLGVGVDVLLVGVLGLGLGDSESSSC